MRLYLLLGSKCRQTILDIFNTDREHPFIDPFGLLFNMNGIQNRYTPPQLSS